MKKQVVALSISIMAVGGAFAQKKELKTAEKALKKNNITEAVSALKQAEALIEDAKDKYKSKFYFLKGKSFLAQKDQLKAGEFFLKLLNFEKKAGKRYTSKATPILNDLIQKASDDAVDLYNNKKNYGAATDKFYLVSKLSPKDTVFMYNAAVSATQAKKYDTAIKYYKELLDLGFTDVKTQYTATEKKSGKTITFPSKKQRNLMMKSGAYIKPQDITTKSKKVDIVKGLALLYKEQGNTDKAIQAFKEARKAAPKDLQLILAEAYMYNDMNKPEKFEELMKEAISQDPNNPDLFFNIGIVNYNAKNGSEAEKYFKKALELKADYKNGHYMLANSMLLRDVKLVDKMNALPPSDMKNYEKLEKERETLFKSILPVILKADELNRNQDTVGLIISIYQQLADDAKVNEYKKIKESL